MRAIGQRFAASTRGNVAMIFGLSLPVLLMMTVGGVDIHRASTVRVNLQDALDAAALAAARSKYSEPADIQRIGLAALRANLKAYPDITLREDQTTFVLNADSVVIADSKVDVKTLVANVFLPPYGQFMDDRLPVAAHSEVNRSSKNLEVALVLDITGSMNNGKIEALKSAALELVDIVVQDTQTPNYSKMSIVPYSVGVNVGPYANTARGAPVGGVAITGAGWAESGKQRPIQQISRANPAVVTSNNHSYQNGDIVWIRDVMGMTQLNDRAYRVAGRTRNTFQLQGVDSRSFSSYHSNGKIDRCLASDCSMVITANNHGLATDDYVYITGVRGMTQINNDNRGAPEGYKVTRLSANTFSIGLNGADWNAYSGGGTSYCGQDGCEWRVFLSATNRITRFPISSCVSERTGSQAYTDAYTTSARVGRNYAPSSNSCPDSTLLPLTSSKSTLRGKINGLQIGGSTAGQIGTAWGWYTVAPTFNAMWPSSSAGAYNDDDILKAVIIMTDGDFNTPYCGGVIARDAGSGSGGDADHINCNATNGDPFAQTRSLCSAMKAKGIIVYTVGFQVPSSGGAAGIMRDCATGPEYAYLPSSGQDLSEAFQAIGRDISQLRISK